MDINSVLQTLGTIGIGSTVIAFILRGAFNQLLSKDIEKFKMELKVTAFERETRYARLHEDRARVIGELFAHLVGAHDTLTGFVHPFQLGGDQERKEKAQHTVKKLNEFFSYFHAKEIYLDAPLCKLIKDLERKFREVWAKFYNLNPIGNEWVEAWEKLEKDVPPIKEEIIKRFRSILGVLNY